MEIEHDCEKPSLYIPDKKGTGLAILSAYLNAECCSITLALFALVLGSAGQFLIPLLIGVIVD
jgi:hypothetical protein